MRLSRFDYPFFFLSKQNNEEVVKFSKDILEKYGSGLSSVRLQFNILNYNIILNKHIKILIIFD